jgi:toxin ParE1/3/4
LNKYRINFSKTSKTDINNIFSYICDELKEPNIAQKLISKIKKEILSLQEMPTRFECAPDGRLKLQGIRKIVVDNYIIFYVVESNENVVFIVRILYGKRDWINLL